MSNNPVKSPSCLLIALAVFGMSVFGVIQYRDDRDRFSGHSRLREFNFVLEVLTGQETSAWSYPVTRWTHPATVTVAHGDDAFRQDVTDAIHQINNALGGTGMNLSLVTGEADIVIEGRPLGSLWKTMRLWKTKDKYGCEAEGADYGFFCPIYNEKTGATVKAVVGVASGLPEQRTRSIVLEELVQVLGPQNDVPHFTDSLFFEPDDGAPPWNKQLSHRDNKLLRFLYLHLEPGDGPKEILAAFRKHWPTMASHPPR